MGLNNELIVPRSGSILLAQDAGTIALPRTELLIGGNWTAKLEYLYIDLGNISGSFVTPIVAPSGNFVTASYNSHITDNVLRVGVNYRWGGPVVAKY